MHTAAIYIYGIAALGDKPEAIKTVKYDEEKKLIAHLIELQKGYCDNEKPKIERHVHPQSGKGIIECYSEADFRHVALLGMRIKTDANKPLEILT